MLTFICICNITFISTCSIAKKGSKTKPMMSNTQTKSYQGLEWKSNRSSLSWSCCHVLSWSWAPAGGVQVWFIPCQHGICHCGARPAITACPVLPRRDSILGICPAWDTWVITKYSCQKKQAPQNMYQVYPHSWWITYIILIIFH